MENWWEHEEEQVLDAEKQAETEQFEARQKKLYRTGQILVYLIVGMHILARVATIFAGNFKLIGMVTTLLMSAGLIYGVSWVRYIYIAGDVFSLLVVILAIPYLAEFRSIPDASVLLLVLAVVFSVADIVLMAASKSIKEYMYQRRNG